MPYPVRIIIFEPMEKEILLYKKGYRITVSGLIVNPNGNIINGNIGNRGYCVISMRDGDIKNACLVHRLQAFQKYGMKIYDYGIECRHKNGNPIDNSYDNILIGTHSENMQDIPESIRIAKSLHASSFIRKYNREEVIDFYNKSGRSYKKTMANFDISSKGTLHFVLNGRKK